MAEELIFSISFESVSAVTHPEYYLENLMVGNTYFNASTVPDKCWHRTSRVGNEESVLEQYQGFKELIAKGELIRNVKILRGNVDWEDITAKLGF